jgi:MFS family permease
LKSSSSTRIFYIIIISQFCGTSLWFAGNAVLPQLQSLYHWQPNVLGYITSSVQLGFILGTLLFAITGVTDRFSPSIVFLISSLIAAACNAISIFNLASFELVLASRCLTGFFLAGIYPVGMKIASDWNEKGLGHWLGALVGALVLGTAFPHVLKLNPQFLEPVVLLWIVSGLAIAGGLLIYFFVHDGPYRKPSLRFSFSDIRNVFQTQAFRQPAFGYFGHMWELYAFWAFVPWAISYYASLHSEIHFQETLLAFIVIAIGGAGCLIGGKLSFTFGSKKIAHVALISSGICCVLSPWMWDLSPAFFFAFMSFWGLMVVADSPQFSALVAANAPASVRGSAITITTCIGFAITIVSIQLLSLLQNYIPGQYLFLVLAPGPLIGVLLLNRTFTT